MQFTLFFTFIGEFSEIIHVYKLIGPLPICIQQLSQLLFLSNYNN